MVLAYPNSVNCMPVSISRWRGRNSLAEPRFNLQRTGVWISLPASDRGVNSRMFMARASSIFKVIFRLLIALLLLGGVAGGGLLWVKYRPAHATESSAFNPGLPHIDWDARHPDVIRLPPDYTTALRVQTAVVRPAPPPDPLRLRGSLMFDANR